jgi:hypothetical protein
MLLTNRPHKGSGGMVVGPIGTTRPPLGVHCGVVSSSPLEPSIVVFIVVKFDSI